MHHEVEGAETMLKLVTDTGERERAIFDDPMLQACLAGGIFLQRSDRGAAVRWVQHALMDLGYDLRPDSPDTRDGSLGPETAAALVAFKLDNGIDPPDPVVSAPTVALLLDLLGQT